MAPFDSVHSVTSPLTAVLTTLPFAGGRSMSVCPAPESTYAVTLLAAAASTVDASCDSVGSVRPATSGADTTTRRFASGNQSPASAFISLSVISGRKRR